MTRETRIGLLVGLVFIVMFGLVLSNLTANSSARLTGPVTTEEKNILPPQAAVIEPPAPVRRAIAPAPASPPPALPVASNTIVPPASDEPVPIMSLVQPVPEPVSKPETHDPAPIPTGPTAVGQTAVGPTAVATGSDVAAIQPGQRVYVVEANDSLIKIAKKVYGETNSKEYKRIFQANKTQFPDETGLKIGAKLVIPPLPDAPASVRAPAPSPAPAATAVKPPAASQPVKPAPAATPAKPAPADLAEMQRRLLAVGHGPTTAPATAAKTYVVQPGDSLSKIARKTLKSDSKAAIDKIVQANKAKGIDPVRLQIGATLEIPS